MKFGHGLPFSPQRDASVAGLIDERGGSARKIRRA
jgi:hypothetical protein